MRDDELLSLFGTTMPSGEQVDELTGQPKLYEFVDQRWTGRYLVTYRDGKPDGLFFYGVSGD
jgi:hypothetical protein